MWPWPVVLDLLSFLTRPLAADVLCMFSQKLQTYVEVRHRYLQSWAFREMSSPSVTSISTLEKLTACLKTLYEQVACNILYLEFFFELQTIYFVFAFTHCEGEF